MLDGFDPSFKNSYSVRVYIIAVHSLIKVEILSSAGVSSLDFAEIRFILFVSLWYCNNAVPIPKFEVSHMA